MRADPFIANEADQLDRAGRDDRNQAYEILWEPDAPNLHPQSEISSAHLNTDQWHENELGAQEDTVEMVEPFQPIHANLIQFPREIVATRKARPRRAEGPFASNYEHDVQLSIFEVEPEAISIDPVATETMNPEAAPSWMSPEWSGMELDEHPVPALQSEAHPDQLEEPTSEIIQARAIYQAPLNLRAMAAVVDGSLVLAALSGVTFEIVRHVHSLPGIRTAQVGAVLGFLILSALYLLLFGALGQGTLGMRYARIALSTFEGQIPTRRMRFSRLAALVLSILPVGMGLLWSIFDEDHLSWHDRLSGTYVRAY
jgi:uncharacterized RDD family membrane protein YckC